MGCVNSKAKSERKDGFLNGKPSASFFYDEIHKCTERGNGLLFRLINSKTQQWAFYNDSKEYEFHISVVFLPHSQVEALENTVLITDPDDGRVMAKTIVHPCSTKLFVKGKIDGFDAEYQAVVLTKEYKGSKKGASGAKKHTPKKRASKGRAGSKASGAGSLTSQERKPFSTHTKKKK